MSKDLIKALEHVLREALNAVEVHPCDVNDDDVRARFLPEPMAELYKALSRHRSSVESVELPEALGYINAGYVHEIQQGFLPYAHVYPKEGNGCHVAIYTASTVRSLIAAAVERATEEANRRANASWSLMVEKMVAIEREECAKVCEENWFIDGQMTANEFAAAIRSRGEMK